MPTILVKNIALTRNSRVQSIEMTSSRLCTLFEHVYNDMGDLAPGIRARNCDVPDVPEATTPSTVEMQKGVSSSSE